MARFFCDNCGAEVKRNAACCPRCGRSFASVKCPQCGFTGEAGLFSRGCPVCGYCEPEGKDSKEGKSPHNTSRRHSGPGFVQSGKHKGPWIAAGKLSPWAYVLAIIALIGVALVLFRLVR